jgi:hypothetical protein
MKTMNEVAEIMLKKGFESNDVNESGFLDELSWTIDLEIVDKAYLKELSREMEEIEHENHPKPKSLGEYLEKIGEV